MQKHKAWNMISISIIVKFALLQVTFHDMGFDSHMGEKFD